MDSKGGVLMHRYELGKLLGHGNFAKVYRGRNLETGMSVAIKVIDKKKIMKVGMMNHIKREISVMRLIKHPNVVQLHEVMASKTKIYFVLEYVKGGELFDKVAKGKLKEEAVKKYFKQLISAISFCHSRGVYHRDLKPENLLLDDGGNLKVSDFGLSALAETKRQDGLLHTSCGTPAYVAPEVIDQQGYDGEKADIWSCGVVLFVLLAGFLPFHDSNLMEMYRKIGRAEFKFPKSFPTEAKSLVAKILDPNPITRISVASILKHSWFKTGLVSEPRKLEMETTATEQMVSSDFGNHFDLVESMQASSLNAFNIISMSRGLNLSGFFNDNNEDDNELRFMLKQPLTNIIIRLKELAKSMNLKLKITNGEMVKMESSVLAIDFEIFEIMPNVHLIEVKHLGGDRLEFREILNKSIKPALSDIEHMKSLRVATTS
ncbi:protein kinase, ATP binding site [Artemisia annua]|uniref:non-specific serine/threonine protein kinase n=1 Tax=Artemisia annua TaxID=35608 RepID=A0A2U1QB41_ARTAN|nr:protein kinase, ATP binding site [Artemisia annua]